MRAFIFLFILLSTTVSQAEFCNWGFAGPRTHRCNGETYYHGTAACRSGFYEDVFCHSKYSQDGQGCADDNTPETLDCYNRMVAPRPANPAPSNNEWCNWGFVPPEVITCEGQKFVYGSAACASGMYSNIFCKKELSGSGKECSDDMSPVTMRCYNKFIQPRSATGSVNQQRSNPSGVVQ